MINAEFNIFNGKIIVYFSEINGKGYGTGTLHILFHLFNNHSSYAAEYL